MEAEVGDEQMGSDPTVWALCDRTAALLGKEAAVFLPSGTMCNQVAIATHCRPGEEILAHESSHILSSEGGAPAAIAGALIKGLTGERGQFTADTLEESIRPVSRYSPTQRLVEFIRRAPSMWVDRPCACAALVTACSASTLQHAPPPRFAVCSTSTRRCVGE